jgi:hypothetical protein
MFAYQYLVKECILYHEQIRVASLLLGVQIPLFYTIALHSGAKIFQVLLLNHVTITHLHCGMITIYYDIQMPIFRECSIFKATMVSGFHISLYSTARKVIA